MKVYVDLVILLNLWLDFLIILTESLILKRNTSIKRIFLASVVGSFSTFLLFMKLNSLMIILIKVIICIMMNLISFGYKDIKYFVENIIYFYLISVVLAGFVYIIKNNIRLNEFTTNFLFLIIISPTILYFYYKKTKKINNYYNHLYNVSLFYNNKVYNFTGFVDTGNRLYDQYKKRPIILVYTKEIKFSYKRGIMVPFETAAGKSIIRCLEADRIVIDNMTTVRNVLFGLSTESFNMGEVNMILHSDVMKGDI